MDGWYKASAPDDLVVITVLVENSSGNPPDADDVADFEDNLGLVTEVWGDWDRSWIASWGGKGGTSQHSYTVLDEEGWIVWRADDGSGGNMAEIIDAVDLAY